MAARLLAVVLAFGLCAGCGRRTQYYAGGTKRAEGRVSWWTGRAEGAWTFWYPNGERAESGTYEDGHRTGAWTEWYPSGQRQARGARARDPLRPDASPRQGLWTLWFENGERAARGNYRDGRREGHWDVSHDDGGLDGDGTGEYQDDQRID